MISWFGGTPNQLKKIRLIIKNDISKQTTSRNKKPLSPKNYNMRKCQKSTPKKLKSVLQKEKRSKQKKPVIKPNL